MEKTINEKVVNATKWSTITEILAKLVVPITNLILARILAPDAFGVIATVTMLTSFADMLTDAGFQKYLIQHEFSSKKALYKSANVAFITNFSISIIAWIIIVIFRDSIAILLGNEGLGLALSIASIQLLLTALSSIQMALYKRNFDFKTLFYRRIISVLLPFFVTIPLALLGANYWSLIIGTLAGQVVNVIILTVKSEWKPRMFFDFKILKEMFSFSIWTLIESIIVWASTYIDVFIIGHIFNNYYLGLYNNSLNIVNAIMNVVTSSITPVLLSGLSRYQNNEKEYNNLLFKTQRFMACLIVPMGIGIWLYRDLVTEILLGDGWQEAANIIGIMSITVPFLILLGNCVSICYISKGRPKLSIFARLLYIIPLIPLGIYWAKSGFWDYVYLRNLFKFELVIINLIILNFVMKISAIELLKSLAKPMIAVIIMSIVAILLQNVSDAIWWSFISIFICMIVYVAVLYFIDKEDVEMIKKKIQGRKLKQNGNL